MSNENAGQAQTPSDLASHLAGAQRAQSGVCGARQRAVRPAGYGYGLRHSMFLDLPALLCSTRWANNSRYLPTQAAAFVALNVLTLTRAGFLLLGRERSLQRRDAGWGLFVDIIIIVLAVSIGLVSLLAGAPGPECHSEECRSHYAPETWRALPSWVFFVIWYVTRNGLFVVLQFDLTCRQWYSFPFSCC